MKDKKFTLRDAAVPILALLFVALIIVLIIVMSGKDDDVRSVRYDGYLDTYTRILDYSGDSDDDFSENCRLIVERLDYYNKLFDIYHEYDGVTNLATVNSLAGKGPIKVDCELLDFLEYCVWVYELTDGNVNVAMGSVLSLWHEYRTAGKENPAMAALPPMDELSARAEHCKIENIVINREDSTVTLIDPEMSLDVGAVAKGYTVERIADMLAEREAFGYVIDSGGNLRTVGTKPDGSGWSMGVKNPKNPTSTSYVYTTTLTDSASSTSGNYERYYTVDGVNYHHIINKDTLMPAEYFDSVTVIMPDAGLSDVLSTALFNMDYESGRELVRSFDDILVVWVFPDGSVVDSSIGE